MDDETTAAVREARRTMGWTAILIILGTALGLVIRRALF